MNQAKSRGVGAPRSHPVPRVLRSWKSSSARWLAVGVLGAVLGLFHSSEARSQDPDWQKVGKRSPSTRSGSADVDPVNPSANRWVGVQFGYPGVFSPRALVPIGDRSLLGPGFTLVPDLTGFGLEYRYQLVRPRSGSRPGILPGAALTVFNVKEGDRSSSPVALNLFLGMMYRTDSNFSIGGDIGLMQATGSKKDDDIDAFGIEKGLSTSYVSFSLGYYF